MAKLIWDAAGERIYETGVDHGVLYKKVGAAYPAGVVWNGLVSVSESPSGAEPNPIYADNIKYLNLISPEDFAATIEAYTYPDEFAECDGSSAIVDGVYAHGQRRTSFGLSYRTKIGDDISGDTAGYKLHLIWGATAAPSEKAYGTVNESPEAITFSWELSTVPEITSNPDLRPIACMTIDSTKVDSVKLKLLEDELYGDDTTEARLPSPNEVITLVAAG